MEVVHGTHRVRINIYLLLHFFSPYDRLQLSSLLWLLRWQCLSVTVPLVVPSGVRKADSAIKADTANLVTIKVDMHSQDSIKVASLSQVH